MKITHKHIDIFIYILNITLSPWAISFKYLYYLTYNYNILDIFSVVNDIIIKLQRDNDIRCHNLMFLLLFKR